MLSKVSLGVSLVLAACVVFLFTKLDGKTNEGDEPTMEARVESGNTPTSGQTTLAYVVEDSILANYQYVIDEAPLLEDRTQAKARVYQREIEDYQLETAKWQEYLSSPSATEADRNLAMEDMAKREQKIQALEYELEKLQLDFNSEVFVRVTDYLEKYSLENNIDVVLNKSSQNVSILYSNGALDITNQIVAGMNADYSAENVTED